MQDALCYNYLERAVSISWHSLSLFLITPHHFTVFQQLCPLSSFQCCLGDKVVSPQTISLSLSKEKASKVPDRVEDKEAHIAGKQRRR